MRLFFISTLVFFVFLGTAPNVWAGDEIIDYLTNTIYQDCQNQDIQTSNLIKMDTPQGKEPVILKHPVSITDLREVVQFIIENEPYDLQAGGIGLISGKDGNRILWCGDKQLDINFYTYHWNGERLDPFIYNVNQTVQMAEERIIQNIENYITQEGEGPKSASIGSGSQSEVVEINTLSKNQILFGFTLTIGLSFGISYFLFYRRKNRLI